MSVFCRHNRFTADCPICAKGTVLEGAAAGRRSAAGTGQRTRRSPAKPTRPSFAGGPNATTPGYEDEDGRRYVIRLEKVPGGVRMGEWSGAELRRRAPALPATDLVELLRGAQGVLAEADAGALARALEVEPGGEPTGAAGVSKGRSGDFKEELRIEALDHETVRVGRWVLRPALGWQLQEAAPMLPAKRYAEAVAGAVRAGALPRSVLTPE